MLARKEVYVPAPRAPVMALVQGERQESYELAKQAAGDLFRSIPWAGVEEAGPGSIDPTSDTQPVTLDVHMPAAALFGSIPWTGEQAEAPTDTQRENSVASVLARFNWE